MEPLNAVLVGSENLVAAWSAHEGRARDVLVFTDDDAHAAYEAIVKRRPAVVVLEQMVAAGTRGTALMDCVRSDPSLSHVEIRVLPAEGATALAMHHAPAGALVALAHPLHFRISRRAARVRMPDGIEAIVDGRKVQLVDVSIHGAQVVSGSVLKPSQRVRITLEAEIGARFAAAVAWSAFELRQPDDPRYRAGMEFADPDPKRVQAFYKRLRGE